MAYVAEPAKDGSWRYLGTAPVLAPSHQDDPEGVEANLKIRAKIQALERREILPWAETKAAQKRADDDWNKRLLTEAQRTENGERRTERPDGRRANPRLVPANALPNATMDDLI